jgi:hypothetical protein
MMRICICLGSWVPDAAKILNDMADRNSPDGKLIDGVQELDEVGSHYTLNTSGRQAIHAIELASPYISSVPTNINWIPPLDKRVIA